MYGIQPSYTTALLSQKDFFSIPGEWLHFIYLRLFLCIFLYLFFTDVWYESISRDQRFFLREVSWMFSLLCFNNLDFHVQLVPSSPAQDWPPCSQHWSRWIFVWFCNNPLPSFCSSLTRGQGRRVFYVLSELGIWSWWLIVLNPPPPSRNVYTTSQMQCWTSKYKAFIAYQVCGWSWFWIFFSVDHLLVESHVTNYPSLCTCAGLLLFIIRDHTMWLSWRWQC